MQIPTCAAMRQRPSRLPDPSTRLRSRFPLIGGGSARLCRQSGPEGAGAAADGADGLEGGLPCPGAVAGPVVGEDFLDGDAEGGEVPAGASPEPRGGDGAFVAVDLGVGDGGAVV